MKATDNSGGVKTSTAVAIVVNPAPVGTDMTGPDCVALNSVAVYELTAANVVNITTTNWWCNSSVTSIIPFAGQPGKVTVSFGPWFAGGSLCVGVNYSAAPWYKLICKTISLCPTAQAALQPTKSSLVSPNPTDNTFNFTAKQNIQSAKVFDELGIEKQHWNVIPNNQSIQFGDLLPSGIYFLNIEYEDKTMEVIKLSKIK